MTFQLSPDLDLGKDTERMTPADKRRQEATVNQLLQAFTSPLSKRREVQLLADEVGLGKTFVALATAYSMLQQLRQPPHQAAEAGFEKCYRAVVVIVPKGNRALAQKWHQDVEALRLRCGRDETSTNWFRSRICHDAYDLAAGLRLASDLRRNAIENPCILICPANVFSRRMQNLDDRLRFLAACLFRWWGNKLSMRERYHIVRRCEDWARYACYLGPGRYGVQLWDFEETPDGMPFDYGDIVTALNRLAADEAGAILDDEALRIRDGFEEPVGLLPYCKEAARRKGHHSWYFQGFKDRLLALHKQLAHYLINKYLPLVIVDEAHHWRHHHRQDLTSFRTHLAPKTLRLLLLTATPFQLHRSELHQVLSIGDAMEPAIGKAQVQKLAKLRDQIEQAMNASQEAGTNFCREWGSLPDQFAQIDASYLVAATRTPGTSDPRTAVLARLWQQLESSPTFDAAWDVVPVPLRPFFAQARQLQLCNQTLGNVMRQLIIRHRRPISHRRILVGREYPPKSDGHLRPDQHLLHLAPGAELDPQAELAQYLLMKIVADATRDRRRTALGMDITGCYTTLWSSKEGRRAVQSQVSGNRKLYQLFRQLTGYRGPHQSNRADAHHPKLRLVVDEVLRQWDRGEKTLIFCFRKPTAETLAQQLTAGVELRLKSARQKLLKTLGETGTSPRANSHAVQRFRRSLTARDSNGITLFLDRVLIGWLLKHGQQLPSLTPEDRSQLAVLYARARTADGRPVERERLDRVFLNRAIEHVWAQRLLQRWAEWAGELPQAARTPTQCLLQQMADERWVCFRYGYEELSRRSRHATGGSVATDVAARSSLAARYMLSPEVTAADRKEAEIALTRKSGAKHVSPLEQLVTGPNLFAPVDPQGEYLDDAGHKLTAQMRNWLFEITYSHGTWNWQDRAKVLDAVLRALLREDILLRLPQDVFQGTADTWPKAILRGLHRGQEGSPAEPLAARIDEFLKELANMGPTERAGHLQYAMNPLAKSVMLVTGATKEREAAFNGFNTPLLPDILICTQVGQEGIDLHRHCRHVIHYDLGWNPATLEQRTGRADRLGSKALRERARAASNNHDLLPSLDIALPYLAGTYDERMYDRLRSRAQEFEILTGGDLTADRENHNDWQDAEHPGNVDGGSYVPLPAEMIEQLRVDLTVVSS